MPETVESFDSEPLSPGQAALDALGSENPDIIGLKSLEVGRCFDILTQEFGIKTEFFEGDRGPANTLLLASVAANLAALEATDKTPMNSPRDYEHIADLVMVIAMDHVTGFDDIVQESKQEAGGVLSDEAYGQLIDRYTSRELTEALAKKIETKGLLNGVREKLGITSENEDPFELRVLSVASTDSLYEFKQDSEWPDYDNLPPMESMTEEERRQIREQGDIATRDSDASREWANGLVARRHKFASESGNEAVPAAFVTHVGGKTYLCLAADTAELLAYDQDELRHDGYDDSQKENTLAYLHHEYTHTQGFVPDANLVGIGIEERRAEWYSGDHHGYRDIKVFFQDIRLTTGFDIISAFETSPKGGGAEGIYTNIATSLGLDMLVKIAATYPRNYVNEQTGAILKNSDAYIGGYDGVIEELAARTIASGGESAMAARLDETIAKLKAITDSPEDMILPMRENVSVFGTNLIRKRMQQQQE